MNLTIERFIQIILFILPAYVANGAPVIFGGGMPLDLGKKFIDGRRIFGDNKTVRGLLTGVSSGIFIGLILSLTVFNFNEYFGFAICQSVGAHIGDLFGSFVKRRFNLKPGQSAPILDQLGFLIFAFLIMFIVYGYLPLSLTEITVLVILTLILHPLTNLGAYILKLKSKPY